MHGLLRCNNKTGVHVHAQSGRVTQRCHNSPGWETGVTECGWRHAPEARGGFGEFEESELSWGLPREKTVSFRLLVEALGWYRTRWGGGRWKSLNRKIVPLSPYVEEPLNSKVIKSFVPEQRSRQVFFKFRDSYVLSLWTFDVHFTHRHIMAMVHK